MVSLQASKTKVYQPPKKRRASHTVDGRIPAPPNKKPWNDDSAVKCQQNQGLFPMVSLRPSTANAGDVPWICLALGRLQARARRMCRCSSPALAKTKARRFRHLICPTLQFDQLSNGGVGSSMESRSQEPLGDFSRPHTTEFTPNGGLRGEYPSNHLISGWGNIIIHPVLMEVDRRGWVVEGPFRVALGFFRVS